MSTAKPTRATKKKTVDPLMAQLFDSPPRKGELMKERIILSAIHCIAAKGIEETSFEAIGKPLGIGRSHVAYHYKDKTDIIATAIQYVVSQGQVLTAERLSEVSGARAQMKAIIEAFFDWAALSPDGMAVYVLFLYYCTIHKDYRDLNHSMRKIGTERMAAVLKQDAAIAKGRSSDEIDDIVKNFQYLGFGALIELVTSEGITPRSIARARRQVLAATDTLLDGA